jgi:hypothetical protein
MARQPKDPLSPIAALEPPEDSAERAALRRRGMRDPIAGAPMILKLANGDRLEVEPGQWRSLGLRDPKTGLPPGCPVIPLGKDDSGAWFLDTLGEIVKLPGTQSGKGPIDLLFAGRGGWLTWAWPRWTKKTRTSASVVNGWAADEARVDLFHACWLRGIYDESATVRGLGGWLGDDGSLIYHAGDGLLIKGRWRDPGEFGDAVYPARRAIGRPADQPEPAGIGSAGDALLEVLRTFNWERGELDARLALGWTMSAKMSGALRRRPVLLVTGAEGSGKSTFQDLIRNVMIGALLESSNTTQAGIYQRLKQDSIAIMIDEMEGKDDTRTTDKILELARICYSGDTMQRGGKDGVGTEFTLRSSFLASCITKPATTAQDDSRMVHLMLRERENADGEGLGLTDAEQHAIGRRLLRRLVDGWGAWPALLARFRAAMLAAGHDERSCDTFGTLAAASHLALSDALPDDGELREWAGWLDRRHLGEIAERSKTWERLLHHLLNERPESLRHEGRKSAGEAIAAFRQAPADEGLSLDRTLAACGLAMSFPKGGAATWETGRLFVPLTSAPLADLLRATQWAGRKGAPGPWGSVLRQMPTEFWTMGTCAKGQLTPARGLLINLAAVFAAREGAKEDDGDERD